MALVIRTKTKVTNNSATAENEKNDVDFFRRKPEKSNDESSIGDPIWELIDPNPNIHDLFLQFNDTFFQGRLAQCEIRWSPRMTSCAGICNYEGRGGLCSIRLSEPLLKLRPRKDLVETMLHEMIHAYLFVTNNNKDRDDHGPEFQKMMNHITLRTGINITIYHSFHAEVAEYQKHWWRCDGQCQRKPPFFGWVKRAMNRVPGPYDFWFDEHQKTCGGKFIKVKEPEDFQSKAKKSSKNKSDSLHNSSAAKSDVISSTPNKSQKNSTAKDQHTSSSVSPNTLDNYFSKLPGKGRSLVSATSTSMTSSSILMTAPLTSVTSSSTSSPRFPLFVDRIFVNCPVCGEKFEEKSINVHLDECVVMH